MTVHEATRRAFGWAVIAAMAVALTISGCSGSESDPSAADVGGDGSAEDATAASDADASPLPEYSYDGSPGPETLFSHGVASGDPTADAVVLWTRVSPTNGEPVEVYWELGTAPELAAPIAAGWTSASAEADFTVKVDATGLEAGQTYYYRFRAQDRTSPLGRTRTLPSGATEQFRLAVVSCADAADGWFHVYRHIAERADIDVVIHLGDYFYEYAPKESDLRQMPPDHELVTLGDYRTRYAAYRGDPYLQEAHRQHPWIAVWDDHEVANNAWSTGADNHDPTTEGAWETRRAAAEQAYFEWLPIRDAADRRVWRSFKVGDLLELFMLDTRLWGREKPVSQLEDPALVDPDRQLLGADQEAWLLSGLTQSTAQWKVLGQQVMMGQLKVEGAPNREGGGIVLNLDQWDGYPAARARIWDAITSNGIDNVVVLTGDVHTTFAQELTPDPNNPDAYDPRTSEGALGVEFIAPAVTSPGLAGGSFLLDIVYEENPHIRWVDVDHRGYIVVDISPSRAQADWWHVTSVEDPEGELFFARGFATANGQSHLEESAQPATPPEATPPLAPQTP